MKKLLLLLLLPINVLAADLYGLKENSGFCMTRQDLAIATKASVTDNTSELNRLIKEDRCDIFKPGLSGEIVFYINESSILFRVTSVAGQPEIWTHAKALIPLY